MPFYYQIDRTKKSGRRTAEGLLRLRAAMEGRLIKGVTDEVDPDSIIPQRTRDDTLLLATWNIRNLGNLRNEEKKSGRLDESLYYIAEIISHFDIVALQEVKGSLHAVKAVTRILGYWWDYVLTDVTAGSLGNKERGAVIYDSRKVNFGGLAGEIVIEPVKRAGEVLQPAEQLARTPFVSGFQAGWLKFMLCTVHIIYGDSTAEPEKRVKEIRELAAFMAKRAADKNAWCQNLALLGDFNIFDTEDATFKALTDAGFYIPQSFKDKPTNVKGNRHFDQIAFISSVYSKKLVMDRLESAPSGVFNFFKHVFRQQDEKSYARDMPNTYHKKTDPKKKSTYYRSSWRTFQMSDHFPLWIELPIDFAEPYLMETARGVPKKK